MDNLSNRKYFPDSSMDYCAFRKNYPLIALAALFCILNSGCTRFVLPPPSKLQLKQLDTSSLSGKTIVIDPGHGGPEHGAAGPRGLLESEANLSVALHLWGLLQQSGAHPLLTRTADTSVTAAPRFSLEEDLRARSEVSNSNNADLFISIHHNSDTAHRKKNDMQIYYKMSDSGPSRDIARSILYALKKQFKTAQSNIFPGNYRVLRSTRAPAILGESSFISNKNNEGQLAFQRTLQAEAEGYFKGILDYYQKGVPIISEIYPNNITLSTAQPEIKIHVQSGTDDKAIDPDSIVVTLDGIRVKPCTVQNNSIIIYSPPKPLENSAHTVCVSVRNKAGNSSKQTCASFKVALPVARISLEPVFPVIPPSDGAFTAIDISVADALGRPVIDGTTVTLSTTGGRLQESTVTTANAQARVILTGDTQNKTIQISAEAQTVKARTPIKFALPDKPLFSAKVTDVSGNAIDGVELIRDNKIVTCSDAKGMVYDTAESSGTVCYTFSRKGYIQKTIDSVLTQTHITAKNVVLDQIDNGVFLKQIIMLDPAGTSTESLPILYELQKKIEQAGGKVYLTWTSGTPPSLKERVAMASKNKVDLFLSFEITKRSLFAGYYEKSVQGKRLAENICMEFSQDKIKGMGNCAAVVLNNFILVQTEMPAVWIKLPGTFLSNISIVTSDIYQAIMKTLD
jgi:N-acetylmuramoyl-L-alanine amidase